MNVLEQELKRKIDQANSLWFDLYLGQNYMTDDGGLSVQVAIKKQAQITRSRNPIDIEENREHLHKMLDKELDKMKGLIKKLKK